VQQELHKRMAYLACGAPWAHRRDIAGLRSQPVQNIRVRAIRAVARAMRSRTGTGFAMAGDGIARRKSADAVSRRN
jgi:hypothetical protein